MAIKEKVVLKVEVKKFFNPKKYSCSYIINKVISVAEL